MLLPTFAVLIATSITSPETARGRGSIDARKRTCANFTASDLRKMLGAALRTVLLSQPIASSGKCSVKRQVLNTGRFPGYFATCSPFAAAFSASCAAVVRAKFSRVKGFFSALHS
jgi:hypothetical protein